MKKYISTLCVVLVASFQLQAARIKLSAPRDLYSYVNAANDGDIIELTTDGGSYFWSQQVSVNTDKSFTLRAAGGLTTRPIVLFTGSSGNFIRYNGKATEPSIKKLLFQGIQFDGYNVNAGYYANSFYQAYTYSPNYSANIEINNCVLKNFGNRTFVFTGANATVSSSTANGGNISIYNSEFSNISAGVIGATTGNLLYSPNKIDLMNNLFVGPGINGALSSFVEITTAGYDSYHIDHCTFINSNKRELNFANSDNPSYIKNCIFSNNFNKFSNNIYNSNLGANCVIYYTGGGTLNTIYPFSGATKKTNPLLDQSGITQYASYLSGGTDGLPIGFYGNQIVCSTDEINDLSYSGVGPSLSKSFTISAKRLTNNITISAPQNFEISLSSGSGFQATPLVLTQNAGDLASTIIYIRLKANLNENLFTGVIQISSIGAASQHVNVSGAVVNQPSLYSSTNTLSDFSYTAGSGPSAQQSFVFNGVGLTNDVIITAPTSFEISLSNGLSFSGSNALNIAAISEKVANLIVYARLKSGLSQNNYIGNISIQSTGATTKYIALSGIVNPAPVVVTVSKTSLSNFNYSEGAGPSTIQSFNVSGTGLTSNIVLSAPANFEISSTTGTSFSGQSSLTITQNAGKATLNNIYVRLKAGLAMGTYDSKITISTTGIADKEVNVAGYVIEATALIASTTKLANFEYVFGNGPSTEKSFDLTSTNLFTYCLVSAPANYEISTTSGANFVGSGQILLDQASITGQSVRIYVRLMGGLATASYNGSITLSSSGATSKTVALTGNVFNPTTIQSDPAYYEQRHNGALIFKNHWLFSKNTNNYSALNELIAASGKARGMAVKDGKMLFADRANRQIVVVDGQTGLKEKAVALNASLFTYLGRNVKNTADSIYTAGTLTHNDIKVDNAGNVLISNLITTNTERFQIFKIDLNTGNGVLVIDQANLANLFPVATTLRFDYFGVWGNVNSDAVIYAANSAASAMEVYKWNIAGGIVSTPTRIQLDNTTLGTNFTGLESLGGNATIIPIDNSTFYVDGGATYPTRCNDSGSLLDGFYKQSSALNDSITVAGKMWAMNTGNNGMIEFAIKNNYFALMAASNTTGTPPSSYRLFKFSDVTKSFAGIECLWTFPQAGMGAASNSYRTASPAVEISGNIATIYVYTGENGYGKYSMELNEVPTLIDNSKEQRNEIVIQGDEIIFKQQYLAVGVYSLSGVQLIQARNVSSLHTPLPKGIYFVVTTDSTRRKQTNKIIFN
ncbi:MAG: hypothetical protein AUK44_01490 [Porphyromonadaceae bacterium CG2_30_38_12]|nr:MAG: hypothetical protein AUK44_01490 [Porphyromonadaceae bacterium CG2_30_38_12]